MYEKYLKRLFDFIFALIVVIVISPLLLILTAIGTITMKGNPFFVQKRPGRMDDKTGDAKIFKLIKFRTMSNAKDKSGQLLPDEKRINRYGKFLRSTSLDELPELFNIIRGDMAIIGPRPQLVRDMTFMNSEQNKRHSVRPGLTGLAQVNGRNNITWEKKFEYDLCYINNGISFKGDLKLICQTIGKVLARCDIVREGTSSDMDYGDWLLQEGKISEEEYKEKQLAANELLKI